MKTLYYPFFLKNYWMRMPESIVYLFAILLLLGQQAAQAQGMDLGDPSYSTLTWDHISSVRINDYVSASVGLTKDGRLYTWGGNGGHTSNTSNSANGYAVGQVAPYFVKGPAGETPIKVRVAASSGRGPGKYSNFPFPAFFCLTASGKMYAWGMNDGIAGSNLATFPVVTSQPADTDTTKAKRSPILMTNIGESTYVDMDFSQTGGYGVVIGSSGTAYLIGVYDYRSGGGFTSTFAPLPKPSGVGSSFKYTKVWVSHFPTAAATRLYLKGNDGNLYFTSGYMANEYSSGVPEVFGSNSPAPTFTAAELSRDIRSINPRLVPFPAGEEIVDMNVRVESGSTYAISASGKAYIAGTWRYYFSAGGGTPSLDYRTYVIAPLAAAPPASQLYIYVSFGDSTYYLKQFQQIAMPAGVTSVLSILGGRENSASQNYATLMVGNNNKVYWSGTGYGSDGAASVTAITSANFLQLTSSGSPSPLPDECNYISLARSNSYYSWLYEATNYRGAQKIFRPHDTYQLGIISASGRGYFVGQMAANTAPGKLVTTSGGFVYTSPYPVPISNELLLSCNLSPGTGGPLGEPVSTPGVGVIDCSKTKLYPAPVQGTPSELSLLVTINVTTVGDFSPITISGSGMSLVSGFDKVTATTTGVQTFHIPIKYDGTALTNAFQFTIGQAGSCSADLTNKPSNEITRVWSLNNCSAITPGVLSK